MNNIEGLEINKTLGASLKVLDLELKKQQNESQQLCVRALERTPKFRTLNRNRASHNCYVPNPVSLFCDNFCIILHHMNMYLGETFTLCVTLHTMLKLKASKAHTHMLYT